MNCKENNEREMVCGRQINHEMHLSVVGWGFAEPGASDDPGDYVSDLQVEIECCAEDGEEREVGRICGYVVDVERADQAGIHIFDLFDSHSQELSDFWFALYETDDTLKASVLKLFGATPYNRNLIVLSNIELEPEHRGRKLGLYAVAQTIEHLKTSCAIAIGHPFPCQFGPWADDPDWMARFGPGLKGGRQSAFTRLGSYWEQLGFARIRGTEFFVGGTRDVQLQP